MTNSRLICIAAFAITAVSCGPMTTEPVPDIPQTVEYETVRIEYGNDDLLDPQRQALTQALVGDPSFTAGLTKEVVRTTNVLIRDNFRMIEAITAFPPSRIEGDFFVWEADDRDEGVRYLRFVIEKISDDEFRYLLSGGASQAEALDLFAGEFTNFGRENGEQRGFGRVFLNFEAMSTVDPNADLESGAVAIAFRSANQVRQVRTGLYDVDLGEGPVSAIYEYTQFARGAGQFTYFSRADFQNDGEPLEFLGIRSQWRADLSGRAVAKVSGGSLEVNEVILRECWDTGAALTFADSSPDFPGYEDGVVTDCPPFVRDFDNRPPVYSDPGSAEPEVPGPHPEEDGGSGGGT